jgi:hypothetical protein
MAGDVDVITPSRLEISGGISCTFNYVVGIAVYVDGVAMGHGIRESGCHEDVSFVHFDGTATSRVSYMKHYAYNIVTDVLGAGTHKIEIGILGKWLVNSHTIYVNDAINGNHPSSSTLLVKEFGAIGGGGGYVVERDFSRLNSYLPLAEPYTTPPLVADIPTKLLIPTAAISIKEFSLDIPNLRWFFNKPNAVNKWFIVHLNASLTTSVSNKDVSIEMYKNGVNVEGVGVSRFMSGGADKANLSITGITQLSHNDYIEIYITLTAIGTITFERLSITINEMVGAV